MSRGRSGWVRAVPVVLATAGVALVPACARQGAPRGGEPDVVAPVVVSTRPDTFQAVDVIDDPIRIEFSERISERPTSGTLDDAVIVSPRTGEVRVDHGRSDLEVDLSGGFRPGLVYTVTVRPVIRDMFSNVLREPFEFAFSTGGEFHPTAAAGLVLDRVTGQPVADVRVVARPTGDTTLAFTTLTDTSGIWALRFLPPGDYEVVAFQDRDRDFVADSFEIQGRQRVAVSDTVLADLVIVEPDTSAARLARVEVLDSVSLRLEFDDHLDPERPPSDVSVIIEPDSTTPPDAPPPPEVVGVFDAEGWQEVLAAARDTATDEGAEEEPEEGPGPGGAPGPGAGASLLDVPLPTQELFVRLGSALPPEVPYVVRVSGVVNLVGLGGGGGSRVATRPAPTEPPPADTTSEPSDTASGAAAIRQRPDTGAVPPDTGAVPPDTGAISPDTGAVPPDTGAAPPVARPSRAPTAPR